MPEEVIEALNASAARRSHVITRAGECYFGCGTIEQGFCRRVQKVVYDHGLVVEVMTRG